MAKSEAEKSLGRQSIKGMHIRNFDLLMEIMERIYGDDAKDLTISEVTSRYPALIEYLDSIEPIEGEKLTDRQIADLRLAAGIRDRQREILKGLKKARG